MFCTLNHNQKRLYKNINKKNIYKYKYIMSKYIPENLPQIGKSVLEHNLDGIHISAHVVSKIILNFCPGLPTNISA